GAHRPLRWAWAGGRAPWLRRFEHGPAGRHVFYYLGSVPPTGGVQPVELALASTTRGWPGGNLLLLPADTGPAADVLAAGLARLRWLLAGALALARVNLEPGAAPALHAHAARPADPSPVPPPPQ